jgi:hypothetical protein
VLMFAFGQPAVGLVNEQVRALDDLHDLSNSYRRQKMPWTLADLYFPWLNDWTIERLRHELARVDANPQLHGATYREAIRDVLRCHCRKLNPASK